MEKESLISRLCDVWWGRPVDSFEENFRKLANTPAEQLALAILTGDETAALILADLIQEQASEKPAGYIGREKLVEIIRKFANGHSYWFYPGRGIIRTCIFCSADNSHTEDCVFDLACKEGGESNG